MKEIPFANALALVTAIFYVVCALFILLAPGLAIAYFATWFHGLDLSLLAPAGRSIVTFGSFIFGLVSLTVTAWIFGWVWVFLYNQFSEKKAK